MALTRVPMHRAMRQAGVSLLEGWRDHPDSGLKDGAGNSRLQIYRTIPTSVHPPTAYPERVTERITLPGVTQQFRVVQVRLIVLWALFAELERGDAVDQLDYFLDGFVEYALPRFHEPGPTELIGAAAIDEDPYYVLRDAKTQEARTYYAGIITLEGQTAN